MARDDHVLRNRAAWDEYAAKYAAPGRRAWTLEAPTWGIWGIAERDVGLLPDDLDGARTIELGCGTAYVSGWLARRGARPIGIDNSSAQLRTAAKLQQEYVVPFPLVQGDAEHLPFRDGTFDVAISEYGAAIWCDPYRWIPEAARVLLPGGELIFLGNSTLLMLCSPDEDDVPATDRLLRPLFGMYRFEWPDQLAVEFHMSHGDWIRLFRESGFDVEDLLELRPPEGATTPVPFATLEWARRWPSEEVWKLRRSPR
jgi:ubiquinone/menaquinone biosynthesis C-methylase UbiE